MKNLLTVTAIIEAGAGLALLGVPSVTASLLVGTPLAAPAALILARVGGAAILALAVVCWLARRDAHRQGSRGVAAAMTFYNIAVAAVLGFAGLGHGLHGILLWPAVLFHVAMSAWCIATLFRNRNRFLS